MRIVFFLAESREELPDGYSCLLQEYYGHIRHFPEKTAKTVIISELLVFFSVASLSDSLSDNCCVANLVKCVVVDVADFLVFMLPPQNLSSCLELLFGIICSSNECIACACYASRYEIREKSADEIYSRGITICLVARFVCFARSGHSLGFRSREPGLPRWQLSSSNRNKQRRPAF